MKFEQLVLYKNFSEEYSEVILELTDIIDHYQEVADDETMKQYYVERLFTAFNQLVEVTDHYGLEGNLWKSFLALVLASNENAYSRSCEIVGEMPGTVNELALHDFKILKEYFDFDMTKLDEAFDVKAFSMVQKYQRADETSKIFNKRIRNTICELAVELAYTKDAEEFKNVITEFYHHFGVGKLGLNKAFRIKTSEETAGAAEIVPIPNIQHIYLKDLVGYEMQKKKLVDNTEAFVEGRKANNCLLFGDSGTGKSSSIKAILNEYYDKGLRIIEVYKHQFRDLNSVIEQIKDRKYKFIIYMDDLSFEEYEIEYKYLKAIIEGGLGKKPENVLIYATSNRRHLIRETSSDKDDRAEDMHTSDTVQEKLSLVNRFGVTIYYGAPGKKEFQEIVRNLAEKYKIDMPEEELLIQANAWELSHGGLSGRTAEQFVSHLVGLQNKQA